MTGASNTGVFGRARCAAFTAALTLLMCLPVSALSGQHQSRPSAPPSQPHRSEPPRPQPQRPQNYNRSVPQYQPYRGAQNPQYRGTAPPNGFRETPMNPNSGMRPAFPNSTSPGYARPSYPGYRQQPGYAPPGHLGAWLNENRNAPPQTQQHMLQSDPSFRRLPQTDQQRLVRQLNRVDQMPEAQRERRLARAENLERLSPRERAQVNDSARQWTTLPSDRQAMMKSAFRDLREVPPDQRETVLNSARYQNAFSPEERGILSNMLSVEPYQAPK